MRPLTSKQTAFADRILAGDTGSDSYRDSYNTRGSNKVVSVKAAELLAHKGVQAYLGTQRAILQKKKIIGMTRSLERLGEIIEGDEVSDSDCIKAIERNAKMQGFDAPEKMELKVEGTLLYRIRKGKR